MSKDIDLGKIERRFDTVFIPIEMWEDISKKLKALEIIKDKEPSIMRIRLTRNSKHFNAIMPEIRRLTKEEYDLVKEVLS